jgi:hypothetical protein
MREMRMKNFILFLAAVSGGASFLSLAAAANDAAAGGNWAGQMCTAAGPLCHSPLTLVLATAGLASFWIMMAVLSAVIG